MRNLLLRPLLLLFCLTLTGLATAGKLYQWVDADGVITYSPEPPPKGETDSYEEISKQLEAKAIEPAQSPNSTTRAVLPEKPAAPANGQVLNKQETKLERRLRLAPTPEDLPKPATPAVMSDKPIDHDRIRTQRKCKDLENRISALESRVPAVENIEDLNQTILLLARYQRSHTRFCLKASQE
ncbi:MAG: DUF4124 domain-containing protein [Gammaproteobacteria bacterium]|nr:DUF4124 domain-containing protein [Gammaproteobacteria bacterium]